MARLSDLKARHQIFLRSYRFRSHDWRPGARLVKPLKKSSLALVSSAGLHLPSQPPFNLSQKGGDISFRQIPADVDVQELRTSHRSSAYDRSGAEKDRNLVFPLDRLREMLQRGEIGAIARRHLSLMGSITAPGDLVRTTAPRIAQSLLDDAVDAVLLVPA
jgi:D-proline reductase (dithiol) PrdB